ANTEELMIKQYDSKKNLSSGNTTIGVVATNAQLNKAQANKVASMAHNGYGRTIRPAHSMYDGDTVFAMATGKVEADINVVGMLAARAVEHAVIRAVKTATPLHGFKTCSEMVSNQNR
ncbi:MAG: P1 family peptidase, partial [Acetivibrionales bacterium]